MKALIEEQKHSLKHLWLNKRQVRQQCVAGTALPDAPALQLAFQTLNLGMIVLSALMIWKGLMVVTKSESPVVVVLRCRASRPRMGSTIAS